MNKSELSTSLRFASLNINQANGSGNKGINRNRAEAGPLEGNLYIVINFHGRRKEGSMKRKKGVLRRLLVIYIIILKGQPLKVNSLLCRWLP